MAQPCTVAREAEVDLFTCPRHKGELKLTTHSCGRMYRRAEAEKVKAPEPLGFCRGCQVGKQNAKAHRIRPPAVRRHYYATFRL